MQIWQPIPTAASPRCGTTPCFSSVTDFSGTKLGEEKRVAPLWKALREAGAELVLTGHSHTYERFAPMTETGSASDAGLRQLVVGTGGEEHHPIFFPNTYATSQKRDFANFGLLRLRLTATGYSWAFVGESGATLDSGSAVCR